MSMSPKDMDFAESKDAAAREIAREIALACGIPPQSLCLKGDNSYSRTQEAKRIAPWEDLEKGVKRGLKRVHKP